MMDLRSYTKTRLTKTKQIEVKHEQRIQEKYNSENSNEQEIIAFFEPTTAFITLLEENLSEHLPTLNVDGIRLVSKEIIALVNQDEEPISYAYEILRIMGSDSSEESIKFLASHLTEPMMLKYYIQYTTKPSRLDKLNSKQEDYIDVIATAMEWHPLQNFEPFIESLITYPEAAPYGWYEYLQETINKEIYEKCNELVTDKDFPIYIAWMAFRRIYLVYLEKYPEKDLNKTKLTEGEEQVRWMKIAKFTPVYFDWMMQGRYAEPHSGFVRFLVSDFAKWKDNLNLFDKTESEAEKSWRICAQWNDNLQEVLLYKTEKARDGAWKICKVMEECIDDYNRGVEIMQKYCPNPRDFRIIYYYRKKPS